MNEAKTCCPCDKLIHPPKPDIPAGLSSLPRQLAGFPEYRRAMLHQIQTHPPLEHWRAREGDDRGVMLIEMWAYVLDILAFYDERIADETYLRTAKLRPSLRRLVELIGYRPRPAVAASVSLAAIVDDLRPLVLPAGTRFRSAAFDGEPPQVFESSVDTVIEPKRNEWTLAPVRNLVPGSEILLDPGSAGLGPGRFVLFEWEIPVPVIDQVLRLTTSALGVFRNAAGGAPFATPSVRGGASTITDLAAAALAELGAESRPSLEIDLSEFTPPPQLGIRKMAPGEVTDIETIEGRDGETYAKVAIDPEPVFDDGLDLNRVSVLRLV